MDKDNILRDFILKYVYLLKLLSKFSNPLNYLSEIEDSVCFIFFAFSYFVPMMSKNVTLLSSSSHCVCVCNLLVLFYSLQYIYIYIYIRGGKSTKILYSSKSTITLMKFYLSKSTSLKIYSSKK